MTFDERIEETHMPRKTTCRFSSRRRAVKMLTYAAISMMLCSCQVASFSPATLNGQTTTTRAAFVSSNSLLSKKNARYSTYQTRSSSSSEPLGVLRVAKESSNKADATESSKMSSVSGGGGSSATTGGMEPPFSVTLDNAENYSYKDAVLRTVAWVSASFLFGSGLWAFLDPQTGEEFFAGYLVEQSLSVDNLFVFLLLFEYFKVPLQYQDRVLNWGIYGAVVMRAVMIGLGAAALQNFHSVLLVFAGILVYGSAKFFVDELSGDDDEEEDPSDNTIVQFSQRLFKSVDHYDGDRFFTLVDGVRVATPLFICMVAVEISDVVFAVDSIPAVFGVTENPLIVFSSNIFAIMGLRSLYTILSKAAADLKYLEPAVALVLGFIGSKMIAEYFGTEIPTNVSLAVVASLLGTGIGASVVERRKNANQVALESEGGSDSK